MPGHWLARERLATAGRAIGWRGLGVAALGVTDALLLLWGSEASTARQLIAVAAASLVGCAALVWIALDLRFEELPVGWVLGLALALRLIAVQATPLLEDDHYRYLWDGFRTATSLDPYRLPPSAFFGASDLPQTWQDILGGINNPDLPTIYGPLLQWLFALAHVIEPGKVGAIQGLLLGVDMAMIGLLASLRVGPRWLLAYAVHPAVLKEAMASAHPDGLVALLLLLALVAWQRRHSVCTGALLGAACATKVAVLVAVPLFLLPPWRSLGLRAPDGHPRRWSLCVAAGFAISVCAIYLPFVAVGGSDEATLRVFGTQWRFNPLLFRVVEAGLAPGLARLVAAFLIVVGVVLLAWVWRRKGAASAPTLPPVDEALLLLLLLSPVVNPWYWLWALGPSMLLRRHVVAAAAGIGALSYANSTVLRESGWLVDSASTPAFVVGWPLAVVQILVVGIVWRRDRVNSSR